MSTSHINLAADIISEQDAQLQRMGQLGLDLFDGIEDHRRSKCFRATQLRWLGAIALAITAGLVGLGWYRFRPGFTILHPRADTAVRENWTDVPQIGRWVTATRGEPEAVAFNDGSVLRLLTGARVRLLSGGFFGADFTLEHGTAAIRVEGSRFTEYHVAAGPFEISLLRADTQVTWDPMKEELDLVVHAGQAIVSGCQYGTGRSIYAKKMLVARCLLP